MTTTEIKEQIDALVSELTSQGRATTRELSLAVTNLEQAKHWVADHETRTGGTSTV